MIPFEEIVTILTPHTKTEAERRALLELALFESPILNRIEWTGNQHTFTVNMVRELIDFGDYKKGTPAVVAVLERLKKQVGDDKQAEISKIIAQIMPPSSPDIDALPEIKASTDENYIFISYARPDEKYAEQVEHYLKAAGFRTFRDKSNILSGDNWDESIETALNETHKMVLLLSTHSMPERKEVHREWFFFDQHKKPIIPIYLEKCKLHSRMMTYNYIDAQTDFGSALAKVLTSLNEGRIVDSIVEKDTTNQLVQELNALNSPMFSLPEWVFIPAGDALIGAEDLGLEEHRVQLGSFLIARTPITQQQYQEFISKSKHPIPNDDWGDFVNYSWDKEYRTPPESKLDHPVVLVTAFDAETYCEWLSTFLQNHLPDGARVMLPSEIEWERAARGIDGRKYPWGVFEPSADVAQFNSSGTAPVGKYPETNITREGCLDMVGNVYEWTRSAYRPYPYVKDDGREQPSASEDRVLRGGCWRTGEPKESLRPAYRHHDAPDYLDSIYGFRPVIILA